MIFLDLDQFVQIMKKFFYQKLEKRVIDISIREANDDGYKGVHVFL